MMIQLDNVSFTYHRAGGESLHNIRLSVQRGECVLLTGRSGCGKTTLTRLINGLIPHFYPGRLTGQVVVAGLDIQTTPLYATAMKIGSVFQDPRSQFFTTTTTAEVAFGCENLGFSTEVIRQNTLAAFQDLGIEELENRSIFTLSSGEKQKIALASAYALKPAVYVLDEPSANLDPAATFRLQQLLTTLKAGGSTIVIAEHRLHYLLDLADRILYLDGGRLAEEWTRQQAQGLSADGRKERGLRAFCLNRLSSETEVRRPNSAAAPAEPLLLTAANLSVQRNGRQLLTNINIAARAGEVIGITGANGAGKTTLARLLCGLQKEKTGRVQLFGKPSSPNDRARAMYFVMQDADYQLFTESVEEELRLGNSRSDLDTEMKAILAALRLTACRDSHPLALSGGQKQRVTIAAAATSSARILIFDEPTSGLDGASMASVSTILTNLAATGRLLLIISHDIEFLLSTCSRIIHLANGRITSDFPLWPDNVRKLETLLFADCTEAD